MSEHVWKAWETCLECQRAWETCLECQKIWETCLGCQYMDGLPKLVDEKHVWNVLRKSFHLEMPAALWRDLSCFQGWSMSLPHFLLILLFSSKIREILYRIIEVIFITFLPLPRCCSPCTTFCSSYPMFCSSCPTICSSCHRNLLILASWNRHPVWSLSWRPGSIPMPMSSLSCSIMSPGYNWMKQDQQKQILINACKLVQNHMIVANVNLHHIHFNVWKMFLHAVYEGLFQHHSRIWC